MSFLVTPEKLQKQREQQRRAQERAAAKQKAKLACPEYRIKQLEKQRERQERQRAKASEKARMRPPVAKPLVAKKPLRSKGMAGKSRNKTEMSLHDRMAALGCICCINKGLIEPHTGSPVSIHHIHGRTSPEAHLYVLPLCQWHHDTPMGLDNQLNDKYQFVFPLHAKGADGGKVRWEEVNGSQISLLIEVHKLINATPKEIPSELQNLTSG
ncbi:recombination enhancement function protein [Alteromonas macleodii]|nr:Ref family recombination enhancement nuclease [Alteromonas macleodii]OZC00302.1 recombination enhancement function protein [Alteromonas macleodii]